MSDEDVRDEYCQRCRHNIYVSSSLNCKDKSCPLMPKAGAEGSDKKIIELDGEKYEAAKVLDDSYDLVPDGHKMLLIRPVPKPLREYYEVVDCFGEPIKHGRYSTFEHAENTADLYNAGKMEKETKPYSVIHMREVRGER